MNSEPISIQIREHDNTDRKSGQDLRQLVDTRLCADRPARIEKPKRAGTSGSPKIEKPKDGGGK
jgi:hypothetical protein